MKDFHELYKRMDKDVRSALWQWLIDHSSVSDKTGTYNIHVRLEDEDDMWSRIYYRYTGQYERYNKLEREINKRFTTYNVTQKITNDLAQKICKIDEGNDLKLKLILWIYRKTRDIIKDN